MFGSVPLVPLYAQARRWGQEVFRLSNTPDVGFAPVVHRAFQDAGLLHPTMRLETPVTGARDAADWIQAMADLVSLGSPGVERRVSTGERLTGRRAA